MKISTLAGLGFGIGAFAFALQASADVGSSSDSGDITMPNILGGDVNGLIAAMKNAIAHAEGFLPAPRPGSALNRPQRLHNPGDISDGSTTGGLTQFSSDSDGWLALENKLHRILTGGSRTFPLSMTLYQLAVEWTGGDNPDGWSTTVTEGLNNAGFVCDTSTTLAQLVSPVTSAIAGNGGDGSSDSSIV